MGGKLARLPESKGGDQWLSERLPDFDSGAWPDNKTDCLVSEVTSGTRSGGAVNRL